MDTGERGDRVLVTGGSGFLGGWLLATLRQHGYTVRTTVRSTRGAALAREMAGGPIEIFLADLTSDEGWDRAAAGCRFVIHAAAPPGMRALSNTDLAGPIVDGTLRVLAASDRAGAERVIVTSCLDAALGWPGEPPADENTFTDPAGPRLSRYSRVKARAEQAAWRFRPVANPFRLSVVNLLCGFLLGPVRAGAGSESVDVVARMWHGALPFVPRVGVSVVDVRDVAEIHVRALTARGAGRGRFVLAGHFAWLRDIGRFRGARVRTLPGFLVPLLTPFHRELRYIAPQVGIRREWLTDVAAYHLGWKPRPLAETLLDCARSLGY